MPSVKINTQFICRTRQVENVTLTFSGHLKNLEAIVENLEQHQALNDDLYRLILENRTDFSLIVESKTYVFAMVDRIKSHPLYYTADKTVSLVSNSSETLYSSLKKPKCSSQALLEFSMAGYVLGANTLYESIKQLQAGELLFWLHSDSKPQLHRYYRYFPNPSTQMTLENSVEKLDSIFDGIMDDLIIEANGRPIFVPLSGGLDSRFILAKLVEKKYDQITAFTYGIKGNHEMQHAETVAKTLNVPWIKLPTNAKRAHEIFLSAKRREYERYSHESTSIPYYGEFQALADLVDRNLISADAMIVNGQSGDYITGGHVRSAILDRESTLDSVFDYIIDKHFSLWLPEKIPENIDRIKTRLQIQFDAISPTPQFPNFYEYWEWQERQCKNVIRGQRLYEFFEFSWSLPLWHADLMDFYLEVPYDLKFKQSLYIEYLKRYNYKNLFNILRRDVQPWVLKYRWIPLVAKGVQFTRGKIAKQNYYKRKDYYSTYHHQYALYGHDYFLKHYKNARNPESLILRDLLDRLYL